MDSSKKMYEQSLFKDYNDALIPKAILTDIVTECLTPECKDCTGSYINEILGHRFLCKCRCHSRFTMTRPMTMTPTVDTASTVPDDPR